MHSKKGSKSAEKLILSSKTNLGSYYRIITTKKYMYTIFQIGMDILTHLIMLLLWSMFETRKKTAHLTLVDIHPATTRVKR